MAAVRHIHDNNGILTIFHTLFIYIKEFERVCLFLPRYKYIRIEIKYVKNKFTLFKYQLRLENTN